MFAHNVGICCHLFVHAHNITIQFGQYTHQHSSPSPLPTCCPSSTDLPLVFRRSTPTFFFFNFSYLASTHERKHNSSNSECDLLFLSSWSQVSPIFLQTMKFHFSLKLNKNPLCTHTLFPSFIHLLRDFYRCAGVTIVRCL